MKPRLLTSILLFVNSYSPLLLILMVKDFDFDKTHEFRHIVAVVTLSIVILLSFVLVFVTIKSLKKGMPVKLTAIKHRAMDIIAYTIPYMLGFIGIDINKPGDIISLAIFLLVLLIITIATKSLFINPVLALFGYGLFDVDYEFNSITYSTIAISKVPLVLNKYYFISSLSTHMYIITREINQDKYASEQTQNTQTN